jgi:hypothetical protein
MSLIVIRHCQVVGSVKIITPRAIKLYRPPAILYPFYFDPLTLSAACVNGCHARRIGSGETREEENPAIDGEVDSRLEGQVSAVRRCPCSASDSEKVGHRR